MITPEHASKADAEAGGLDNTHPIERVGQGPVPAVEKRCGNCKHYGMMKSIPGRFRIPVCFAAADLDGERFVDQTTPGGICELFNPVGLGPIPRPSRVDEGQRRAAAEPLIEPDTAPPVVRVDSPSPFPPKPFLIGHVNNSTFRIWLENGEFTVDVSTGGYAWEPCASWEVMVERMMPNSKEIHRLQECHRIMGLVLAKLDGGAA